MARLRKRRSRKCPGSSWDGLLLALPSRAAPRTAEFKSFWEAIAVPLKDIFFGFDAGAPVCDVFVTFTVLQKDEIG